jgi:hypothetical protein
MKGPFAMLEKWRGIYRFDPEKTAQVLAGFFKDRFVMKEGFEEAVENYLGEEDDEVARIRLDVRPDCILLRSGLEEERFPVLRAWAESGRTFVELDWQGLPQQFEVQEFEGGCLRLHNPSNSLSESVWRPIDDEIPP